MLSKILILLILLTTVGFSQSWLSNTFIDPSDGYLDSSHFLLEKKGLLPVPIMVTEPAVGYGAGLGLVYFHDKLADLKGKPPTVSVVAGLATENGTWFLGGGHVASWKDDTIRYTGGVGMGVVKMKYYYMPLSLNTVDSSGIDFETKVMGTGHEFKFRLSDTNFFAGVGFTYAETQTTFDRFTGTPTGPVPSKAFDLTTASANFSLSYDNRDNQITPSSGLLSQVNAMFFDDLLGSDREFQRYKASMMYYHPIVKPLILGLRANYEVISGDAPFFAYPFVNMRGIKAMQYQGEQVLLGETELRWNVTDRWALIGFVGAGQAYSDSWAGDSEVVIGRGVGVRYMLARVLGMMVGLDVAQGPDDTAFYIVFGGDWSIR